MPVGIFFTLIFVLGSAFPLVAMAEVVRCNIGGKMVYQELPCPKELRQQKPAPAAVIVPLQDNEMTAAQIQAEFDRERAAAQRVEQAEQKKLKAEQDKRAKAEADQAAAQAKLSPPMDKSKFPALIELNKGYVKNRLKDPDSAMFRDVYVSLWSGRPVVCGWVNAKNSFGGYVGFSRFVSAGSIFQVLESEIGAELMAGTWKADCGRP